MNRLNFGCGKKILDGFYNVDIQKAEGIDKSFNFNKFPYPINDSVFNFILVDNVIEHLEDLDKIMFELWRISKPNATINIKVPYYNHTCAYNDYDHKHFFNKRAIELLFKNNSSYNHSEKRIFEIEEIEYIPGNKKRFIPKKILHFLDKFLSGMFIELNASGRVIK